MLHIGGPGIGTGRARRLPAATLLALATVVCLGLGAYWGQPGWNAGVPFALQEAGAVLFAAGAVLLGFTVRVVRKRRRERLRDRGRSLAMSTPSISVPRRDRNSGGYSRSSRW